jgi:formamidopyrimidine-DNA glycosylase
MPELPEVENIKIQLEKYLVGHRFEDVEIRYGKKFDGNPNDIVGGKVVKIQRFGKAQSIDLDNGFSLSEKVKGGLEGKHTHIIFHLDKGGKLYYNDVRKFGWIKITKSEELKTKNDFIKNLGPEPLRDLTYKKLQETVKSTSRNIKTLLMDQAKISGVGNIYANDALWLAKINPKRQSNTLRLKEQSELFNAIETVLKEGLKRGGASELSFITPDGKEGKYQEHTLVYGREGERCKRCKSVLKKMKISGRGTYYCGYCQK